MNLARKSNLALLASAIALLCAPALHAQVLTFDVDLNTAALAAQDSANSPFYLDFQLNYFGSSSLSDSVTLSRFQYTGGSALSTPTLNGLASGNLSNGASLTATSASQLNEIFQQFSATTTDIQFRASVFESGSDTTPPEFSAAILDSSTNPASQVFTDAPDTLSLVTLNVTPTNTLSNVNGYAMTSSADGNTPISGVAAAISVPEPSTYAAIFGGAVALFAFCTRRFRKLQVA